MVVLWFIIVDNGYWSGWWYTYPSKKYEFVSWDDDVPNIQYQWERINVPVTTNQLLPLAVGTGFRCCHPLFQEHGVPKSSARFPTFSNILAVEIELQELIDFCSGVKASSTCRWGYEMLQISMYIPKKQHISLLNLIRWSGNSIRSSEPLPIKQVIFLGATGTPKAPLIAPSVHHWIDNFSLYHAIISSNGFNHISYPSWSLKNLITPSITIINYYQPVLIMVHNY